MNVQQSIIAFITISITLGLAVTILAATASDCSTMDGYDSVTPASSTGWSLLCIENESGTQDAFSLTPVILIVLIAVVILSILGYLSGSRDQ